MILVQPAPSIAYGLGIDVPITRGFAVELMLRGRHLFELFERGSGGRLASLEFGFRF